MVTREAAEAGIWSEHSEPARDNQLMGVASRLNSIAICHGRKAVCAQYVIILAYHIEHKAMYSLRYNSVAAQMTGI